MLFLAKTSPILLFWWKNLKIGKFSLVDIFQKVWTFRHVHQKEECFLFLLHPNLNISEDRVAQESRLTRRPFLWQFYPQGWKKLLPARVKGTSFKIDRLHWQTLCLNIFIGLFSCSFTLFSSSSSEESQADWFIWLCKYNFSSNFDWSCGNAVQMYLRWAV